MAKTKQTFKVTKRINEEVIKEVVSIKEQKGLTPENVVTSAKNKKSSLHNFFEWNDAIAGEQYRLQQARMFINEIKVIVEDVEYSAFENVKIGFNGDSERRYMEVTEILSQKELKEQIISQALNHINYWKIKYANYKELKPIVAAIDEVNKKWQKN